MEKTCYPPQMFEHFFYFMSWYVRRLQADFCKIPQAFISVIAFLHFTKSMSISSTDCDNHAIIFLMVLTTLWTSFSHWPWLHLDLVFPSGMFTPWPDGLDPLHLFQVVSVLISQRADVNAAGGVRERPLHLACSRGHLQVTRLLVEAPQQPAEGKQLLDTCICGR